MADQIDAPMPGNQAMQTQTKTEEQPTQVGLQRTTVEEKKKSKWWLWFVIGLIVGVGLSAVYFLLL